MEASQIVCDGSLFIVIGLALRYLFQCSVSSAHISIVVNQ